MAMPPAPRVSDGLCFQGRETVAGDKEEPVINRFFFERVWVQYRTLFKCVPPS